MRVSSEFVGLDALEPRRLLAGTIDLSASTLYFNDIAKGYTNGSGASPSQSLIIKNIGSTSLTINAGDITVGGTHAVEFGVSKPTLPLTLAPGQTKSMGVLFQAASTGIRTASITIKSSDSANPSKSVNLRGLGTAGVGGELEPSLQRVVDLFEIPVNVGDSNPSTTDYPLPASSSSNEVNLQRLMKAGSGNVTIELKALFVNQMSPAWQFGWYNAGKTDTKKQLFSVDSSSSAQSVNPKFTGANSFDPGSSTFGIYANFPAFSYRSAYSEDALNTWEPKAENRRKVMFFPLKNKDGSIVPNAYVFAFEDWNQKYDFQDGVGIIRNVKFAQPTGNSQLQVLNNDGLPNNNRLVFNRIQNPDPIRPNVTHEKVTVTLLNNGGKNLTVSSLKLSNTSLWKISSGGTTPFTLTPGASKQVTIQFIGKGTGLVQTFQGALTINSNDPAAPVREIQLAALWQSHSEQTPDKKYSEPTVAQIVNTIFGYTTTIVGTNQKMNTGGKPIKVGDEVLSHYWQIADSSKSINVRMLSAFHRQNNFDLEGNPIGAASTIRWYYKGSSTSPTKLFKHHIDDGQSLLPRKDGSSTAPAEGSFKPTTGKAFGLKVDSRFSDPALNPLDFDKNGVDIPGTGHAFRFYPAKDAGGNVISNTYIVAVDNTSNIWANYDYNDHVYLVTNIKPASTSSTSSATTSIAASASLFSSQSIAEDNAAEDLVLV